MAGGSSSKTSTGTASSPFAPLLAKFSRAFMPAATQLGAQESEALRTGGVNAQIPIINRAVDASRQAGSMTNQQVQESLAKAGLSGSSFGQAIMAQTEQEGNQKTAEIPADIASQFIGIVPGSVSTAVGAGGMAANANRTTTSTPSFMDFFLRGLESGQSTGAYATGP